ncbi:hypothetical protein [Brevundimonas sp. SORGH_AS_0993]|uniref:hypothetical protein n=1 Tax=Brevundimonas sp. SORGH_AS_0993 TaxID=3041794 RepID=UPI00277DBDFA|nr:hypothetical protein [Brevundimonas sp. SORGH_AS_0993]MDQ1155397.1 hypothetical protein [Brevundimonas sp. SORGH_AS_0993]
MLTLVLALSGALLVQSQPDVSRLPPEQAAQVSQIFSGMTRMFETLGTCERQFPPEVGAQVRAAMANESDPQKRAASAFLLAAYDKGKASERAATITQEQCTAEIEAISTEMQALKAEMEKTAGAQTD